jgi:hypothetical protein
MKISGRRIGSNVLTWLEFKKHVHFATAILFDLSSVELSCSKPGKGDGENKFYFINNLCCTA